MENTKDTQNKNNNFNKAFVLKKEERNPQWRVIDARGQVVGRLATTIAKALRGKDKPTYTAHEDAGDYVVVLNAKDIVFTGKKMKQKVYVSYSGYMGGKKELTARQVLERDPVRIIEYAVKGMLPKTKLSRQILKKLKVYAGETHPHQAQV